MNLVLDSADEIMARNRIERVITMTIAALAGEAASWGTSQRLGNRALVEQHRARILAHIATLNEIAEELAL